MKETNEMFTDYYDTLPENGEGGVSKLRQQLSKGLGVFVIIAASIVFYFLFLRFANIFSGFETVINILKPVMYGLVIAFLLNPIVMRVEWLLSKLLSKKFKNQKRIQSISRSLGIVSALGVLFLLILLLINLIIPELLNSIQNLIINLPEQLNGLVIKINNLAKGDDTFSIVLRNTIEEGSNYLKNWIQTDFLGQVNEIMSNLTVGVISIVKEIFNLIMGIIISIYIMFSRELFGAQCKKVMYALLPVETANFSLHIAKKSNEIFSGFVIGKIIDSIIIGDLCFIALKLMDMPYTLLVSVIIGVTNIIPFFGPYIGAVPCTILIFLQDPMQGIYFLIFIIILQQIDGNIIGPKILGDSTGLSSFWVIVAILLGGGLFGFAGMIIGVPTFAVLYYIAQVVVNQKLEKKALPTSSSSYKEGCYVDTISKKYVESTEN